MAIVTTPGGFELHYNGYTFDPDHTHTTQCDIDPIPSKDGRTIVYSEFTIGVRTWVVGYPTDAIVQDLVRKLEKSGGHFRYRGRSLGDLIINTSNIRDIAYGPMPKPCRLTFFGARASTAIDWSVVVRVPICADAVYQFAPMDLSFSVEHQLRANGRVNRVVSGELRIPNNRTSPGSRRIMDSPDEYRSDVTPPVPYGFRREWQPWKVNDSRTILSFGWTDLEFDRMPYPPGIAHATYNHSMNSTDKGLVQYTNTIDAEYTPAAGYPPKICEQAFATLVRTRFEESAKQRRGTQATLIPVAFTSKEMDGYNDFRQSFSLTYLLAGTTLREAIQHSGMWTLTGDDWATWRNSVQNSSLSPYGYSQVKFRTGDDAIVDLCGPPPQSPGISGSRVPDFLGNYFKQYPNAESSWLDYYNSIRVEVDSGVAVFRDEGAEPNDAINGGELVSTMQGGIHGNPVAGEITPEQAQQIAGILFRATPGLIKLNPAMKQKNDFAGVAGVPGNIPSGRLEEHRVQQRAAPTCYIFMTGHALRVGFPIPCPELLDVEGVKPVKDNRLDMGEGFTCAIVGNAAVPIYGAKWNLRYFLPKVPKAPITPPANPMYGGR